MKANYNNWMPQKMLNLLKGISIAVSIIAIVLTYYASRGPELNATLITIAAIFVVIALILYYFHYKFSYMRNQFSYNDPDSLAWKIINFTADQLKLEAPNGKVLDVGCGSGALSIAVAKRYPSAQITGVDRWGSDYQFEFSKTLCESNAKAEGADNLEFLAGDAKKLAFADESFDGICSNYVYHNIPGDRNEILKESFRVLKKGGVFAIHDIFHKLKYPKLDQLVAELKQAGFETVNLIDTTDGSVLTPQEAKKNMLTGSKLLCGKK